MDKIYILFTYIGFKCLFHYTLDYFFKNTITCQVEYYFTREIFRKPFKSPVGRWD